MPSSTRRQSAATNSTTSGGSRSRRSNDSYDSQSTNPTSLYTSPRPSELKTSLSSGPRFQTASCEQDVSPGTSLYPRSSVDTYASTNASEEDLSLDREDSSMEYEYNHIPPLPVYRREVVEHNVRPSTPQDFAKLFPSMNRLSIRHDEFTPDGNMNLRIDTVAPGRKRTTVQLFHLRMYDLAKREFSLRRYCRDSGREVCHSKRKYDEPAPEGRPTLQRSMTSAIKTLGSAARPAFKRSSSGASITTGKETKRPGTSQSSYEGDDEFANYFSRAASFDSKKKALSSRPLPTNSIKLEFSNYARVDVDRRGGKNNKRYEFQWWGHKYSWKRVVEKHLNVVSFHLIRDGTQTPVAHIVPETRSPNQVFADESAGGWVPPCFMWISDTSLIDCMTDVADVIMATGLMALVDDCIKERWQTKKIHRLPVLGDVEYVGPKAFMQQMLFRRNTSPEQHQHQQSSSPLRYTNPISAY